MQFVVNLLISEHQSKTDNIIVPVVFVYGTMSVFVKLLQFHYNYYVHNANSSEVHTSPVADPGFLQGGFKIHERARSARQNLTATPPFNKTTPF